MATKPAARRRKLSRGDQNAAWIEAHCRIPEGKFTGRKLKLTPEQREWLRDIYDSPTRVFILSMGRKNAKTATAAFLLLLHLAGPEAKPNSQLLSAAQSRDQAALLFDLAAKIVRMSPDLSAYVKIRDTAKELLCPEIGTVYKALSAEVATSFGKSPAFAVHDELGQVKGSRSLLYESIETAAAAQESPLSIVISTQAPTDADLLSVLIDDGLGNEDPLVKVRLYTAPLDLDPFSDEAIKAANPHYGAFMNQEEVRRQAEAARRMPSRESSYRNLILNQRVEAKDVFCPPGVWDENGDAVSGPVDGKKVWAGLDLSSVSDLTALVMLTADGERWDVHPTFWLPSQGLAEKALHDKEVYDVWASRGLLLTTPGAAVQYEFVADYLRKLFDKSQVQAVAFDRWNYNNLKPWLERAGFSERELARFVQFGQGFASMSPAIRELESMLLSRKLKHGGNPILKMNNHNTTVQMDPAENRKFIKGKATGRIDGMVALAMAVGVLPNKAESAPTYKMLFA